MKLSIACGQNKPAGFKGIDLSGDADITHDLNKFPWPIKANSVTEFECSHYVEHIPHYMPEWGTQDGFFKFFDEIYRIAKKDATVRILHPYAKNDRAFWDPTHTRYINETTWYYLDKNWRESQRLDHYEVKSDFEIVLINGQGVPDEVTTRSDAQQAMMRNNYWNVISDLEVHLKARK
jgi:hypothetical protein